jgi:predicted GH43/DUF377 family glycosyl hydrolase
VPPISFRISPISNVRQKNWMPFVYNKEILLVASVCPHLIYDLKGNLRYETEWLNPWFKNDFLRGNTNCLLLPDGNYLGTFHTVDRLGNCYYYDNGCYLFEGKPPFKVLKCSNQTYLPGEAAITPHFRRAGIIQCPFPISLWQDKKNLFISYGDNDSEVKVLKTTLKAMLEIMVDVYAN